MSNVCFVVCIFFSCIVCDTAISPPPKSDVKPPIESLESLAEYKGCTEINGNLIIKLRGSGGSGL